MEQHTEAQEVAQEIIKGILKFTPENQNIMIKDILLGVYNARMATIQEIIKSLEVNQIFFAQLKDIVLPFTPGPDLVRVDLSDRDTRNGAHG